MMRKALIPAWLLSALSVAGCIPSEPRPFDPKTLEAIQKQKAAEVPTPTLRPLPTTLPNIAAENETAATRPASPAYQPITSPVRLTLQEILHRIVASNLDVRVAGYEPAVNELRILEADARFDPSLISNGQIQRQFQQLAVPTTQPFEMKTYNIEAGFQQNLETGGQVKITDKETRYEFPIQQAFPPINDHLYQNDVIFQITQPLLQNFGVEVNRARVTIARNDQKISELDFRDQVEKTLQKAEELYWQLVQAEREVQIQEDLLHQTERMLSVLIARQGQDVTRIQISQARATLEQRNALLVEARARIGDISDQLKRLMNDPDLPVSGPKTILPADQPVEEPIRFAMADQIETALQNRLELLQQALRIKSAETVIKAARNNELPRLDLQAQADFEGLGHAASDSLVGGAESDFVNYAVGFQFELPIGNRVARAITQRTLLQHAQSVDQYRLLMQQVEQEVATAQRAIATQWNSIIANRFARLAAEDALLAIEERERANEPLTPTFVQLKLDRQSALAQAQQAEIQAVANYNIAIANLEKAKGTLLRYDNVILKEERGPEWFGRFKAVPVTSTGTKKK